LLNVRNAGSQARGFIAAAHDIDLAVLCFSGRSTDSSPPLGFSFVLAWFSFCFSSFYLVFRSFIAPEKKFAAS
jgi:hypothetical protein